MIIRMTCNDNDFSHLIEAFSCNLISRLFDEEISLNELRSIQRALNPNDNPKEEKDFNFLLSTICSAFRRFIRKYKKDDEDYLISNFEVSFQTSMEDKWENGEVVYYFTTNNKHIVQ